MSEDIKKEIEQQVTGTRLSIMKELKRYLASFYIAVFGMIFCLLMGFYIGNSSTNTTSSIVRYTQLKVDRIESNLEGLFKKHNLKYNSKTKQKSYYGR